MMPAPKILCDQEISRIKLLPSHQGIAKTADNCIYRWQTEAQSEMEEELLQQNEVCASSCCDHEMALHSPQQTYSRAGNGAKPRRRCPTSEDNPGCRNQAIFCSNQPEVNMCPYNTKEKPLHKNHIGKFSSDNICERSIPPDPPSVSPDNGFRGILAICFEGEKLTLLSTMCRKT